MEVDWSLHWTRPTPGVMSTNVLEDVNPQEALPHRDVSTERPHLPGAKVTLHDSTVKEEIAHLSHLFNVRTRPELFFDTEVELTIAAWGRIAVENDRLLYDCHMCHVTWPISEDATACPVSHPILED